jgi:hypothetical protein
LRDELKLLKEELATVSQDIKLEAKQGGIAINARISEQMRSQ